MKKLAIIGASSGQLKLCIKARELEDVETYCFAWEKDAICSNFVDHFIPISVADKEKILEKCREFHIDGIVTNASEFTIQTASYVGEKMGLVCTPYQTILNIQNKSFVRELTSKIRYLSTVEFKQIRYTEFNKIDNFPCIIKPIKGSSKKGVNLINSKDEISHLKIDEDLLESDFLVEDYIEGKEISVESLSYKGIHKVIQITDKITSGPPHFAELAHHQPSLLSDNVKNRIKLVVPEILTAIGFMNGASHIEMKVSDNNDLYLIEVNPRGGGDHISDSLIESSTDCDYIKELIKIALGEYIYKEPKNIGFSGIYFICKQTENLLKYFNNGIDNYKCIVDSSYDGEKLQESISNYTRNGFILYKSKERRIIL